MTKKIMKTISLAEEVAYNKMLSRDDTELFVKNNDFSHFMTWASDYIERFIEHELIDNEEFDALSAYLMDATRVETSRDRKNQVVSRYSTGSPTNKRVGLRIWKTYRNEEV